jgi:flagellar biosynthesis protein FlhF
MQLRTFLARDMKEALSNVRADMGPNAVIIASEKSKSGGVMVRAALDEADIEPETAAPVPVETSSVADFESHYRDGLMRRLRNAPSDTPARARFDRTELMAALHRHRTPDSLAHALAEEADKAQLTDMTLALACAIDKRMTPAPIDLTAASALLLVGPNGAGKTAVAAKLAAHARLNDRRITLVAADSAGAGAVARLETFAKHLDAGMAISETAPELQKLVIDCVSKKTLVVIDTAGFDPRDGKARSAFAALSQIAHVETLGIVSALNDAEEAAEISAALKTLGARRLIITGLDLARRAGALLAAATQDLPLAHVTRSPFVASGLESPTSLSIARLLLDENRSTQ